jgi:hypothetical protein
MSALHRSFVLTALALAAVACSGAETQDVLAQPNGAASSSGGGSSGGGSSGGGSSGDGRCTPEQEPNDHKDQANVLDPARCGTLSRDDKRDFLTFQLKPTTKTLKLNFTGRIRLKVDVPGGGTVNLTPDNAGAVPFVMGAPYLIEVTALNDPGNEVPWRVEVVEN